MAFSGALTLTDLNDFLGPSQACIKPVEQLNAPPEDQQQPPAQPAPGAAATEISIDADGHYYEASQGAASSSSAAGAGGQPRARTKLETAQISLNDCLACSGCVTSAETVLISMQSHAELRRAVQEISQAPPSERKVLVASISPQSLASLSARYSYASSGQGVQEYIPLPALLHRIAHFLRTSFGFDHVVDTTFARHIALREHAAELMERRQAAATSAASDELHLPMLASACPGWVCYAEKTHAELLPLIARTKSPQQIAGVLAKHYLARQSSSDGRGVYHVAVMPCYDKKLEASRADFFDDITGTRDVDCVLTTGELDLLMQEEGFDINRPLATELADQVQDGLALEPHNSATQPDRLPTPPDSKTASEDGNSAVQASASSTTTIPSLLTHAGSSSGSYLFHLMQVVWTEWVHAHPHLSSPQPTVEIRMVRSSDFTEYVLHAPPAFPGEQNGDVLFKAAQCYGFRNLQNLVRKVHKQVGIAGRRSGALNIKTTTTRAEADEDNEPLRSSQTRPSARGRLNGRGRGGMVKAGTRLRQVSNNDTGDGSGNTSDVEARPRAMADMERGYDYIEVMACPGGCTNGGGQLRPPTDVTRLESADTSAKSASKPILDPEKFTDGWATPNSTGAHGAGAGEVDVGLGAGAGPDMQKGWQGTSKEWVKRVEAAYWAAADPMSRVSGAGVASREVQRRSEAILANTANPSEPRSRTADQAADEVIASLCQTASGGTVKGASILAPNEIRARLLRTQYHAVQDNEVSGLAVQW